MPNTNKFKQLAFDIVKEASQKGELHFNHYKIDNADFIIFDTKDDGTDYFRIIGELSKQITSDSVVYQRLQEAWYQCQ